MKGAITAIAIILSLSLYPNPGWSTVQAVDSMDKCSHDHDSYYAETIPAQDGLSPGEAQELQTSNGMSPPPYQAGWPQTLEGTIWNAVSFVDLDSSAHTEVLAAATVSGIIHIKNYDGTNFPNWPVYFGDYNYGAPVAGDVDNDGDMEVFLGANAVAGGALLFGWEKDGTDMSGWPISFPSGFEVHSSAVLSDLDDNGDLEIIFSPFRGDNAYVFNHDGTNFPGWPKRGPTEVRDAPAVGDLDGDGDLEILCPSKYEIYAWHHDGRKVTGFPVSVGSYYTDGIAMGDLDADGFPEIIVNTVGATNNIMVYDNGGSMIPGWPQSTGSSIYAEPCLGDLDSDGDLEVIIGGTGMGIDYHVWAWHHDGTTVDGWPAVTEYGEWCQSSAVIGDIDNDGDMEVVIGSDNHKVYAFHHDATLVADWPLSGPTDQVSAPVSIGDIDWDGDIEIGVGSLDRKIHIWDLDANLEPANVDWGTYHHDHWFTGWYHPVPPVNLTSETVGDTVFITWSENPEPDVAGYNLYRSTSSGYPYSKLNSTLLTDTSYMDTNVTGGNRYYYVVTACIRAGSESRYSGEISVEIAGGELVELVISPSGSTVVPIGGILEFGTVIRNNTGSAVEGDYWLSLLLPNSNEMFIPEMLLNYPNPLSGQVAPYDSVGLDNELWVHPRAIPGSYQVIGRIGRYPNTVIDADSLGFEVVE